MKPCRDCGTPTSPQARACPRCGIVNPVQQWVSYPDGSHLTAREPVPSGAAALALDSSAGAPKGEVDRLAAWAVWSVVFAVLSVTVVGGAVGGAVAAAVGLVVHAALPVRADGRKLPAWASAGLIALAAALFLGSIFLRAAPRAAAG